MPVSAPAAPVAAKPVAPVAVPPGITPTLPPDIEPAPPVAAAARPVPVEAEPPVEQASAGQQLLGRIGTAQVRDVQRYQLLSLVSSALTERIGQIGRGVWELLRGDK